MVNTIQDISKELNIEFDNVLKLFKNKFINNNIYINSTKNDFFEYDYYEDIIIKFNELSYNVKESYIYPDLPGISFHMPV